MVKRSLALLTACLMLLAALTACAGTDTPVSTSSGVSNAVGSSETDATIPDSGQITGAATESGVSVPGGSGSPQALTTKGNTGKTNATTTRKTDSGSSVVNPGYEMPFDEPVTFTVFLAEHPNQPIKTDAIKWDAITQLTNVTLDVDFVAQSAAANKLSAATASGQMYDITWIQYMWLRNMKSSVFMDLTDLIKTETPHYYELVKDDPDLNLFRVFGKYLGFSMVVYDDMKTPYQTDGLTTAIRKDILDKENLKVPTSWQQWFDVMKQLKKKYPNSTPFSGRSINFIINYMAQAMTGYEYSISYNSAEKKYTCGALQNSFRPLLQFMKNCYDEGILDPNFDKVSPATFLEAATSNKLFFWIDNGVNLYTQNNALQATDKNAAFVPMNLMTSHLNNNKKAGLAFTQSTNYATMYCLSATTKHKEELLHFMDWCYSDEGMLVNCCGRQDDTYKLNKDGTPYIPESIWSKFSSNAMPEYAWMSTYGLGQLCFAPRVLSTDGIEWKGRTTVNEKDDPAFKKQYEADLAAGCYRASVPLQPDVDSTMQSRIVTLNKYISNQMVKFIKGTRPLSEFNTFVNELNKMGIQEVLDACNKGGNG